MTTKTPYELRMEMVKLAYDYLDNIQSVNNKIAMDAFKLAIDQGKTTWAEWDKHAPKSFSLQDVISKAEEIYGFVSKK